MMFTARERSDLHPTALTARLGSTCVVLDQQRPYVRIEEGWVPYVGGTRLLDARALRLMVPVRAVAPDRCSIKYVMAAWRGRTGWKPEWSYGPAPRSS